MYTYVTIRNNMQHQQQRNGQNAKDKSDTNQCMNEVNWTRLLMRQLLITEHPPPSVAVHVLIADINLQMVSQSL